MQTTRNQKYNIQNKKKQITKSEIKHTKIQEKTRKYTKYKNA